MKKSIILIGMLIALSLSTIFAKSFLKPNDIKQTCSLNWLEAFYSVQNTKAAIDNLGFNPREFFVVKTASSGSSKYAFTAIAANTNEASLIYNTSSMKQALVVDINYMDAKYWLKQFEILSTKSKPSVTATIENSTNIECEFLYGKDITGIVKSTTVIGMLDSKDELEIFLNKLENFSRNFLTDNEKFKGVEFSDIPTQDELDNMSQKILTNRFFEIESWD